MLCGAAGGFFEAGRKFEMGPPGGTKLGAIQLAEHVVGRPLRGPAITDSLLQFVKLGDACCPFRRIG